MKKEKSLLNDLAINATKYGSRLFRNNNGIGWVGRLFKPSQQCTVKVGPGDVVLKHARPLHAGLCTGSSDLIGWTTIEITEDMVGRKVAVFTGAEVKIGKDRESKQQESFRRTVIDHGGIALGS